MPPNADRGSENDIRGVLHEIRDQVQEIRTDQRLMRQDQERHSTMLEQSHRIVTGGDDPTAGLAFQVAELRKSAGREKEKTTFWLRTLGASIIAAVVGMATALFGGGKG